MKIYNKLAASKYYSLMNVEVLIQKLINATL